VTEMCSGPYTTCVTVFQPPINCNLTVMSNDPLVDSAQRDARALGRVSELLKHSRSQAPTRSVR
jgi:hypothetical protein